MKVSQSIGYIVFLSLLTTACATQAVTAKIHGEERLAHELSIKGTEYPDYVRGKDISIRGEYYGLTTIDDNGYHIIMLKGIRNDCGQNHEALVYLSTTPTITSYIKETTGFARQKTGDIEVIFADGRPTCGLYTFCPSNKLVESLEWAAYPDKLYIYFDSYIHVRYGPDKCDTCLLPIQNRLEWQCRSKTKFYATHAIYPFSVAYDVVTLPIQWLLWQVWH